MATPLNSSNESVLEYQGRLCHSVSAFTFHRAPPSLSVSSNGSVMGATGAGKSSVSQEFLNTSDAGFANISLGYSSSIFSPGRPV